MKASCILLWALLCVFSVNPISGFVPPTHQSRSVAGNNVLNSPASSPFVLKEDYLPVSLRRQRSSVARVQTMGLFGLGLPEIAIILAAAVFLLGPEKIGNMAGSLKASTDGGIPDELKKIPEEFQKGVAEGEANARARNAKQMDPINDDEA